MPTKESALPSQTPNAGREARKAIDAAMALAHRAGTPVTGVLPTACVGIAVDKLVHAGSIDALQDSRPDMQRLMTDLFNWSTNPRGTKAITKAMGRGLTAVRVDGVSLYPHAVEALSFAAAIAPLLEPDRLVRILDAATAQAQDPVASAYAPIRYPAQLTVRLTRLLSHYQEARREQLLVSLWEASHAGRWWDATANLGRPKRKRRRRAPGETRERGEAVARQVAAMQAMEDGAEDGDLLERLLNRSLAYSPQTVARLSELRIPDDAHADVAEFVSESSAEDPDMAVLCAYLADLKPGERPQNPILTMVETLEFVLGETAPIDFMPKKPDGWSSLYPKASLEQYPFSDAILGLNWQTLPGTGVMNKAAVVEIIQTPHDLFENREYMGNCTYGYNDRCRTGNCVIGRIIQDGEVYNFSLDRRGSDWIVTQVNSRYNGRDGHRVPDAVRLGLEQMVGAL